MRARGLLAATQSVAARLLSDLQSRQAVGITAVTHVPRDWESVVPDPVERPTAGASLCSDHAFPWRTRQVLDPNVRAEVLACLPCPSCHWVITAAALYPLQRCVREEASAQFQGDQQTAGSSMLRSRAPSAGRDWWKYSGSVRTGFGVCCLHDRWLNSAHRTPAKSACFGALF
jgi:hypothetical protein